MEKLRNEERIAIYNLVRRERPDLSELQVQRKTSQIVKRIENGESGDFVFGEVIKNAKTPTE